MKIIAKTFQGLEGVLATEIENLGGKHIKILKRAVSFEGPKRLLYEANYQLRTALRILVPIFEFKAKTDLELYANIFEHNWDFYLSVDDTFSIDSTVGSHFFPHSKFAALRVKDAIVDKFRQMTGDRPNVDTQNPTIRIHLLIRGKECEVFLDSSSDPLFKRGYRIDEHPAPLNEVLAAGLILLSGWDKKGTFIDPMCGSGTLAIEAAMMAKNIPPGKLRRQYGFMTWRNFDAELWQDIVSKAQENVVDSQTEIYASDSDRGYIKLAKSTAHQVGLQGAIQFSCVPFEQLEAPTDSGTLIMNPPYGVRFELSNINGFYKLIGDTLKSNFANHKAWIMSGDLEAIKKIGLRPSKRYSLVNGSLDCKFNGFELYKGSHREPRVKPTAVPTDTQTPGEKE